MHLGNVGLRVQLYIRTSGSVDNRDTLKQCPGEEGAVQSSQKSLQYTVKTKQHKNAIHYRFQIKANTETSQCCKKASLNLAPIPVRELFSV